MVLSRVTLYVESGADCEERCFPAKTRRSSDSDMLVRRARSERRLPTEVDSGMVIGKAARRLACYLRMRTEMVICWEGLTVAGYVLDEDLHGGLGLRGRSAGCDGGDGGDAVGSHVGGGGGCKKVLGVLDAVSGLKRCADLKRALSSPLKMVELAVARVVADSAVL